MRTLSPMRTTLAAMLSGMLSISALATVAPTAKKKAATHSSSTSSTHKKKSHGKTKGKSAKSRGQKAIESERAEQIQEALIREHYMTGEPSGKWDDSTQAALRRYQADQGWQSKSVPDSRALIKLGLGPSHDHLLNPESAMTTTPESIARKSVKPSTGQTAPANSTPAPGVPQK